jgi:hypothetical protein
LPSVGAVTGTLLLFRELPSILSPISSIARGVLDD